ncbi:hypothetical protein GXW82_10695 [Streptacidiphilus sp. 4-A2]|nr:hypothetical protein [Streptacidiphilus sp. 4-A2]
MYFQDGVGAGSIQALEGEEARIAAAEAAPPRLRPDQPDGLRPGQRRRARLPPLRPVDQGVPRVLPAREHGELSQHSDAALWTEICYENAGCATAALATRSFRDDIGTTGLLPGVVLPSELYLNNCGFEGGCGSGQSHGMSITPLATASLDGGDAEVSEASCLNSFAADTRVVMADGKTEQIRPDQGRRPGRIRRPDHRQAGRRPHGPGDPGAPGQQPRQRRRTRRARPHQHVGHHHEHLFWDATSRDWVPADQLQPGHALRTDGTRAVVADVQRGHGSAYRYNLTVDQLHTYYVLAGSTPVLVHNCQLALGWRTKGTAEWAGENGFNHMIANPDDGWKKPTERMIGDPNVTLHVNTTGWGDFPAAVRAGLAGEQGDGAATNLEMSWIARLSPTASAPGTR